MPGIGFIGLGIMGEGMAARLLSEGVAGTDDNPLVVWNRTAEKCAALAEKFADKNVVVKPSAKEVVEACQITYSMLSTPEASKAVFDADEGTLAGVGAGKSIVDCATLAEVDMQRMNEAVVEKGGYVSTEVVCCGCLFLCLIDPNVSSYVSVLLFLTLRLLYLINRRFLEAPVSGSKAPAAQGSLIFLCAGSQDLFNEIKDNGLAAMGKASHFFGTEVGAGTRAKLVVNSLMGTMLAAYGECLALAENVGLDASIIIDVIGAGAIQSPMYSLKGPKMLVGEHAPNFPLKHAHKDMALACEMAKKAGVEYSVMEQAEKLFRDAREDTELNVADQDFSAVFEIIHKNTSGEYSKKRKQMGSP